MLRFVVVLGTLSALVMPTPAQALSLRKAEARAAAEDFVRERLNGRRFDAYDSWYLEAASWCSRVTPSIVECDFQYVDEDDVDADGTYYGCEDTIRIRESRRSYSARYAHSADCSYGWSF